MLDKLRGFRLRGLAAQIVMWTVLPLTLVLIGVAFTGVYSHEQAMRSMVEERDRALAVVSAAQVRELLRERAGALERLAAAPGFQQGRAAQGDLLAEAGTLDGLFAGEVALLDEEARVVADGDGVPAWAAVQQAVLALVRAVTVRQGEALSPVLDTPETTGLFLIGIPVYDASSAMTGVLAGPLTASTLGLDAVLSQAQVGKHGAIYLVDPSGRVAAHSPSAHARASLAGHTGLAIAQQATGSGATECLSPEGEKMALAYAPLDPGPNWHVILEEPWSEISSPVLRYSQAMPLVAALAAVVALLTLYYGVRSLVQPLRALTRRAEQLAWGDFDAASTPVGGVEEIEDLRRTMDQMARRIQAYQRGMHSYIAAITEGQEEERKRLARELHDETAQALIALGQQVEMASKLLAASPERAAERLQVVRKMLSEAVEGVRRFSRDLRPIYLEDLGFVPALEMLAGEARQRQGLVVEFRTTGPVRRLPPEMELAAYRIVQEALHNVLQHAQASHAWVEVRFEPQALVLRVRDDGKGFEAPDLPDALAREGHFGLMGMQERALLYGGTLTIQSAPDRGTEITVRFTFTEQQVESGSWGQPPRS
jgi:signal transduction histidine kinase